MRKSKDTPSAELFSRAFHRAPVAFGVCSAREGRFSEANESFLRLIGYERQEVVGRTDVELKLWADAVARQHWAQEMTERGAVRELECRWRTKEGELRQVLLSAETVVGEKGSCVLLVIMDTTERQRREAHLHQTQKMEAVGQLAAGFAHDFNNILAIIQGYTGLLLAEPGLEQPANQALKEIAKASERAAHLTRQLLTLSRKQYLRLKPLNLNETLQRLGTMLHRLLGENTVLQLQLAPELPAVRADNSMLEQLLANLALNARDAMPHGGQLRISTSAVRIDAETARNRPGAREGEFICLSVADNGCGMDAETLNRIFEPFFTTKAVGQGAGLGLATVYGIVKQHQGWIEVTSQPGEGSTFTIYLVADVSASAAQTETLPGPRTAEGRETVLVVEDESSLSALVRGILERYGYQVFSAATGADALSIWEEHEGRVDLLLTDLVMPGGVSGAQLAEKLKAQNPRLKVIYTSGYSADLMSEGIGELIESVNFLQKPYRPHLLAQTVRNCLDGVNQPPAAMVPATMG